MNKCEHGQKITTFCASDCCVWKQAAGCETCMKKYHNHMGPTIFLSEEEIVALVKKYTMDSSIKPKCRLLQEAIYSYFNLIKNEITTSIDTVCKNIINQIGYPYLYSNNTLSTYKRLKNKEYKKLVQKQFKNLYQLSQKINQKDLTKEESKIYIEEMKHTEELLNGLEEVVKRYESIIKSSCSTFAHDNSYFSKINQILKALNAESPRKASRAKQLKERESIKPEMMSSLVKEKQQSKLKPLELKKAISEQTPAARTPIVSITPPVVARPNYSRDVSIDRKMIREHKFSNAAALKTERSKEKDSSTHEPKQNTERGETTKETAKHETVKQQEINEKKKMLIDMMKQKEDSLKKSSNQIEKKDDSKPKPQVDPPSYFKRELSERSAYKQSTITQPQKYQEFDMNLKTLNDQSEQNQTNEWELMDGSSKNEQRDVGNHAFTQLPLIENDSKKLSEMEEVKQKVFLIPKTKQLEQFNNNYDEIQSPIFKNFNKSTVFKPKQKQAKPAQQQKVEQRQQQTLKRKTAVFSKHSQILQLKDNQEKSLALLLKSLALNAEEAIKYLQSALDQAQNNLSAAEYLTYVYLQQDKPHDCLLLCNKMLEKLINSNQPEDLALIMNNNKAAALNILGRYSESIVILEKCLRYREKDYFYKNLGDAYFSISIYEKAIYNYEKCLKINECYDEAQYNLAVCLYIQENYFNAKLAIKKALEMQPQNEAYLELLFNIETRITHC